MIPSKCLECGRRSDDGPSTIAAMPRCRTYSSQDGEGTVVEGQVVLVTGGAQGIGRWISHSFAKEGAKVAVADVGSTEKVVGELQDLTSDAIGVKADVRNEDEVRSMVDQ